MAEPEYPRAGGIRGASSITRSKTTTIAGLVFIALPVFLARAASAADCMKPDPVTGGFYFDNLDPACRNPGPRGGYVENPDRYAAIAISPSTLRSGSSHGQTSEQAAKQLALANCATGAADCKLANWGYNLCFALVVSRPDGAWGQDFAPTRAQAQAKGIAQCRLEGGKNCVAQSTPCASDDPRWPSPLPLPPSSGGRTTDLNTAGTWELFINPGRWIWQISPYGTYTFHSEATDPARPSAGMFSASDGRWSIRATDGYTDGGTYVFQYPDTLIATGRLGTGIWRRIAK